MNWFSKVKKGLSKTSKAITSGIAKIFKGKEISAEQLDALEELLISADIGPALAFSITSKIAKDKIVTEDLESAVRDVIKKELHRIIANVAIELDFSEHKPNIILLCGVNGNGKTTTAGKLAHQIKASGKKVMLVACDTFRAAAVEQLELWAKKTGASFVKGQQNSDPASVAFQAIAEAVASKTDVVIIDTAGRLHNKIDLMNELAKIKKVIQKHDESAPHNTILVLDATTGQNALSQVAEFTKLIDLTGLIITKLDGTAKGGIAFAIAEKFKLPIHAIGVGEGVEDMNAFNPENFVDGIIE